MTERAIHLGLLVSALALATWAFSGHGRNATAGAANHARSPLSIIPPGSAFVLSADVARLEQAPLGAFLTQWLGHLGRTSELTKTCGFDPLTQ